MYKVKEESIKMLEDALNYLDLVEVKGVRNCNSVAMIASLIQQFASSMDVDDGLVADNTPESNKNKAGG